MPVYLTDTVLSAFVCIILFSFCHSDLFEVFSLEMSTIFYSSRNIVFLIDDHEIFVTHSL